MKTRQDPSTKPYYRCLACPRFRQICGGRPTRDMDLRNWCEYICDIMESAHLTNTYVAEKAEVSIKTIERIRACNTEQDIMRATARRIELAVIGPVTRHICDLDFEAGTSLEKTAQLEKQAEIFSALEKENESLRDRLSNIDEQHRKDIRAVKEEYEKQAKEYLDEIAFLKDEVKAWRDWHKKQDK